mgnify:CR=1 FL=1|jgi:hypothetical protein|tara:strand:+ start:1038 stop:1265 length:228 start_codon:yes stop_codon:yes gene_type:complete
MVVVSVCSVAFTKTSSGNVVCLGDLTNVPHATPFDISQLDPVVLGNFFAAGFLIPFAIWAAFYGGSQVMKAIDLG